MSKVTIISAYHRRSDAVRVTLEAIANQSYDDWEALIWDDGSPDDTWSELDRVAREISDPRIKVFRHEQNLGFVGGMNFAISQANSEYIAIVGSGDAFVPSRIRKQVDLLDQHAQAPFCATGSVSIDPVTNERFVDNHFDGTIITAGDLVHSCPFTHGSVMYRRSALLEVGLYEPAFTWSADWDLFNRLLVVGDAVHIPEKLYFRYARMDGASFSPEKSVLQVKFAHLAHLLRERPAERDAILRDVMASGLDGVLQPRSNYISDDLRTRQVKLFLLGKREQAAELGQEIDRQFGMRAKWGILLSIFRMLSYLPTVKAYSLVHKLNGLRKSARRMSGV